MAWKNWPAWLKGGIIGVIVSVILYYIPIMGYSLIAILFEQIHSIITLPWQIIEAIFSWQVLISNSHQYLFWGALIINGFLIGLLIGWIIGKIKQEKLSYLIKGALIGFIIYTIIFPLVIYILSAFWYIYLFPLSWIITPLIYAIRLSDILFNFALIIRDVINGLFIGAIIGWIYGLIKSRQGGKK